MQCLSESFPHFGSDEETQKLCPQGWILYMQGMWQKVKMPWTSYKTYEDPHEGENIPKLCQLIAYCIL